MPTAEQFVEALRREVGYTECPRDSRGRCLFTGHTGAGKNHNKFAPLAGHANGQPWCRSVVVAKAREVGLVLPNESAYTPTAAQGYKDQGRWHTGTPQPGDEGFIDFPGDDKHRIQHTVVVVSCNGTSVATLEGNTSSGTRGSQDNGGGFYPRKRDLSLFVGFGRPQFTAASAAKPQPAHGGNEMLGPVLADLTKADKSQVINIDGVFYIIDEGVTAAAFGAANAQTIEIGATDYAQFKAVAKQ